MPLTLYGLIKLEILNIVVLIKYYYMNQEIYIATDGSAKTNARTFDWIISTLSGRRILSNIGVTNGYDCYSYRSESTAIVSILYLLRYLSLFYTKHHKNVITIFTDGEAFLKGYKKFQYYSDIGATPLTQFMCAEWELLNEIHCLLKKLSFTIKFEFVKSHQDKELKCELLELPAQLNVDADKLAEDRRLQTISSPLYAPNLPNTKLQLLIDNCTITKKMASQIEQQYQARISLSHFTS